MLAICLPSRHSSEKPRISTVNTNLFAVPSPKDKRVSAVAAHRPEPSDDALPVPVRRQHLVVDAVGAEAHERPRERRHVDVALGGAVAVAVAGAVARSVHAQLAARRLGPALDTISRRVRDRIAVRVVDSQG
eukprot:2221558-Pleurochrysis_carterae.AAC.2